jgi:AcrR family transcriptional regulator
VPVPPERLTREARKARTRSQLLEAAGDLFRRQGFAATSLEQVAQEAGLTKGAVYAHFSSKVELFLSFVDEVDRRADLDVLTEPGLTYEERFRALGHQVETLMPTDPEEQAFSLELRAFALRNPRARRALAARLREQIDEVEEVQPDDLEFDRQVALQIMAVTQALVWGLGELRGLDPGLVPPGTFEMALAMIAMPVDEAIARAADRRAAPPP